MCLGSFFLILCFLMLSYVRSINVILFVKNLKLRLCPREVCVEVAKEYPESTSQFYLPRCVALHRCGGCCTSEAFYCTNTTTKASPSPPPVHRDTLWLSLNITSIQSFIISQQLHQKCDCLVRWPSSCQHLK
uniref:Vascular endothelial growth factor C-like n=1 Tax=Gouania willdenowi TaxID=441366 RepID=A0A8C5N289_GOUWI